MDKRKPEEYLLNLGFKKHKECTNPQLYQKAIKVGRVIHALVMVFFLEDCYVCIINAFERHGRFPDRGIGDKLTDVKCVVESVIKSYNIYVEREKLELPMIDAEKLEAKHGTYS